MASRILLFCPRDATGRSAELRKKYLKIVTIVLLAGAAAYALGGFLLAPRIVKYWIEHSIATEPGQRLGVEGVYVNPFTLFISLTNVTLIDEKNKPMISLGRVEHRSHLIEKLRMSRPGYDVEIRDLQANDPSTGEAVLTIPNLSATGLIVNVAQGTVSLDTARIENPELNILRDSAGEIRLPAWLGLPQEGSPPAAIRFDALEVTGGKLRFNDHTLLPALRLDADGIVGTITRPRLAGAESTAVELEGRFGESGSGEVVAAWQAPVRQTPTTVKLTLRQVELATISPYFAQIAGRGITAGSGDITFNYERHDTSVQMKSRLVIDRLRFSDRSRTDTDIELPLELAVALITDRRDHIDISIPASQHDVDPAGGIADSLTDYINDLAATPFDVLAGLVGREDEGLGILAFPPGSAEITPAAAETIALLSEALDQRPLLALRAYPAFDPAADRDAIASQQVQLHIKLATSAGPPGLSTQTSLDFEDPKVCLILDEFAGARLPESRRLAISSQFESKDIAYYRAVHDALVANEDVSETVLRRLARFRARSIIGALVQNGVDEKRLLLADAIEKTPSESSAIVLRLEALRRH